MNNKNKPSVEHDPQNPDCRFSGIGYFGDADCTCQPEVPSVDTGRGVLLAEISLLNNEIDSLGGKLVMIRSVINGPKHSADKVAKVSEILNGE